MGVHGPPPLSTSPPLWGRNHPSSWHTLWLARAHTALLTHSLSLTGSPHSPALACCRQLHAPTPPPPCSASKQVQRGGPRGSGVPARERQGRLGPSSPSLLCLCHLSWPPGASWGRNGQRDACRRRAIARAAGEGRGPGLPCYLSWPPGASRGRQWGAGGLPQARQHRGHAVGERGESARERELRPP